MGKHTYSISDEAVINATGKSWEGWFSYIDANDGKDKTHKEIVAIIKDSGHIDPWWQQMVTVEYEKSRGLRKKHERPDGFQISKNKTIKADAAALFEAWVDPKKRKQWLDDPGFTIRKATEPKTIRITWVDGQSDVNVSFYAKDEKTQVSINHGKLPDEKSAAMMKDYWMRQLQRLAELFS